MSITLSVIVEATRVANRKPSNRLSRRSPQHSLAGVMQRFHNCQDEKLFSFDSQQPIQDSNMRLLSRQQLRFNQRADF